MQPRARVKRPASPIAPQFSGRQASAKLDGTSVKEQPQRFMSESRPPRKKCKANSRNSTCRWAARQRRRSMSALPPIVLASASPRRRNLLADLGLDFEVLPVAADETPPADVAPPEIVQELARRKAALAKTARPEALLIACDTLVFLDGVPLEKPRDRDQALEFLGRLAGREHSVFSGLAVWHAPQDALRLAFRETRVLMRALSNREMQRYVDSGEPYDKAGGYGIQGRGALLIDSIQGDYYNVMGLPLTLLDSMLQEFDLRLLEL